MERLNETLANLATRDIADALNCSMSSARARKSGRIALTIREVGALAVSLGMRPSSLL